MDIDRNRKAHRNHRLNKVQEGHIHNVGTGVKWFFSDGINENGSVPFDLICGDDVLGAEVLLLDSGDTPQDSGMVSFVPDGLQITDFEVTDGIHIIKYYYGVGTFVEAEVLTVGVFMGSKCPHPVPLSVRMLPVGTKIWAKLRIVGQNLKNLYILLGLHEYPIALEE